ncbi:response regulator [Sulfurimonas sp. SAG-AH-194-C20]|nr:hybrid sensor histidine kinase/response regulator [Sulfurimonas sp. SAG-AH-194-C20]MDF1878477.1 response regulator [Sulfurimonas sp. SAG-AH-194-C20]
MKEKLTSLTASHSTFVEAKDSILLQWVSYRVPKEILVLHDIDRDYFLNKYASGVFDYFMGVISGEVEVGNCPVMQELLTYFKKREISADELFAICSHFRRSMVDFSYDAKLNSKELFDEISYIFDENFKGILKFYTDTIFQKLIDAKQEALQAGQAKEYFFSNMSHEIRTPLNAILGFVNLLLDDDLSKKHRNYLDIIHISGKNLLSLISDILDFSKLRSGEFSIEEKVFSLHEELSHTMELFVANANAKNITISSFINPKIPVELYGDALRIKQILSNLLSNAIKFTPQDGLIEVEGSYVDEILKISVKDSGIGINKADLSKIFSAFSQAESRHHEHTKGTGLGLSICSQLVEKMGGTIEATSSLELGSRFIVKIPVKTQSDYCVYIENIEEFQKLKIHMLVKDAKLTVKHESFLRYSQMFNMNISIVENFDGVFDLGVLVHDENNHSMQEFIANSQDKFIVLMSKEYDTYEKHLNVSTMCFPLYCAKIHTKFNEILKPLESIEYAKSVSIKFKGHILVAEDNEANQELIKILLQKYGLTFDMVTNGLEALSLYKIKKYDLVLLDEQMPVMNGNETLEKILLYEESEGIPHTPISALTANVLKGAKERGLLSGFDEFLVKPLVLKELERVFTSYLKTDTKHYSIPIQAQKLVKEKIIGLDSKALMETLMLSEDEVLTLLKLYLKKMKKVMPELLKLIQIKDYEKIALSAHSIKGSSANFRIELMQNCASEIEIMAENKDTSYDYEASFIQMSSFLTGIRVE